MTNKIKLGISPVRVSLFGYLSAQLWRLIHRSRNDKAEFHNNQAVIVEFTQIWSWHCSFSGYNKSMVMENNENQNRPARDAKTSNRGLASADPKTRAEVARKGGEAVSKNREHMAAIGRKGGQTVSQDRQHMSQIGRKGGEAVSRDRQHMSDIGRKGGENSRSNEARHGNDGAPGSAQ
jgi:general stress protein YciG